MLYLGDIIRLNARRYPRKKALIMDNRSLTFDELNRLVNQISAGLREIGLKQGDRVAILSRNCMEFVPIVFAIWKCGGIMVPFNFRFKSNELMYVINNSQPKILFHAKEMSPIVEEATKKYDGSMIPVTISGDPVRGGKTLLEISHNKFYQEPEVHFDTYATAMIMYTSGTTGTPKGVMFTHWRELSDIHNHSMEMDLRHEDIMLVNMPLFHNGGLSASLMIALLRGCTCVIMGGPFDPDEMYATIDRCGVTVVNLVPTMLRKMVEQSPIGRFKLTSLKKIMYGASPISEDLLAEALDIFKVDFYQLFAQTETGMLLVLRPEDHYSERSQFTGRETCRADIRVVDENGRDVKIGEVGEIISRQKPLGMDGYYGMEEATRETIRDGWIHTGDLVRVEPDGYYTVVDRLKDMIISGAENIYCKEIEFVISEHPGVEEVVVIGIPDDMWGESVCAIIVEKSGYGLKETDIINFCASRLSGYKKPKKVDFIKELPKNAAGKVLKKVLKERYWAGRKKRV